MTPSPSARPGAASTSEGPAGERTVVHLLRHGEVHNPDRVLYGRLPGFHLSQRGRQMAERVAQFLDDRDIAHVTSSPLERARETSSPIAAAHGLPVRIDPRLIEAGNHFQGSRFGHGEAHPARPANWSLLRNPFRPSWGEAYEVVAARMIAAIGAAARAGRGREVVLVSHQLPIWVTRLRVEGRRLWHDPRRRECSLASLTSVVYVGNRPTSVTYCEPAADLLPDLDPVPGA